MDEHEPMGWPEALTMKGDAWILATEALKKRGRAEELNAEVQQLLADARAMERSARIVQRAAQGDKAGG